MNSFWDWLVVIGSVGQIALLGAVAFAALRLKNGPITAFMKRGLGLVARGKALTATGQRYYERSRPHLAHILVELTETGATVRRGVAQYDAATAGPRDLLAQWAKIQTGLAVVRQGAQWLRPRPSVSEASEEGKAKKAAQPGQRVRPRSLAHRLGLVPPIVQKLERFFPVIGYAVGTFRELKRRGIV